MATATPMVCSSCEESEIELYYCETCSESAESNDQSNERELMCAPCLGPHVRKGHRVRTLKGQEPLICSQHRLLHNQYCKTCDVTFCGNCLGNHSEHKMGSIDERAIEIKKEVFEMLTKLELDEKPLRAKKESISELKKVHEVEQFQLRKLFEKEVEELKRIGLNRIDQNLSQVEKVELEIIDRVDKVLSLQKSSRDLLILTSPHLIHDFKQVKLSFEEVCKKSEQVTSTEYCSKSSEFDSLKEEFEIFGREVDEKLETYFDRKATKILKKFAVTGLNLSTFIFVVENGLKIFRVVEPNSRISQYEHIGELEFTEDIISYCSIFRHHFLCSCIIFTTSNTIYRVEITKSNICEKTQIDLPSFQERICPYTFGSQLYWCYWLRDRKVLKFSHKPSFEIECCTKPKRNSLQMDGYQFCLVTETNEILIVDPYSCMCELIPFTKHGVTTIDHLTLYSQCLLIWSVENKSILYMLKTYNQWNALETVNWQNATQICDFWHDKFGSVRFLPALDIKSANESNYSFVVFF